MANPETVIDVAKAEIKTVLDNQTEFDSDETFEGRVRLLSAYSLLSNGESLSGVAIQTQAINGGFTRRQLSKQQRMDAIEVRAGYSPKRHEWIQGVERSGLFVAFLKRMHELQSQGVRDLELEQATVEIVSPRLMGGDENGNLMLQYMQVRSDEVYVADRVQIVPAPTAPQRMEDIVGFPLNCAFFTYGEWVGFEDENAHRWFVMEAQNLLAPLDAITGISSAWDEQKKLKGVEYRPRPLAEAS
jgi:hypothetical protein